MKADRRLGRQTRARTRRPARRAALREAVAADAIDVRDRDPRARRRHAASAGAVRRGHPRAAQGHRAQPRAMGARAGDSHLRAGKGRDHRRGRPPAARHQRADRRGASLSGARRCVHAARAMGRLPRPDRSRSSATATTSRRRWLTSRRMLGVTLHVASPAGYELPDQVVERRRPDRARRRRGPALHRPAAGGRRRRCGLHGRLGVDGRRGGSRTNGGERSRRIRSTTR